MGRLDACRLCMDMSHAVHWGYDPVQAVRDFAARIAYVHLHDFKDGQTVELGEGPMWRLSSIYGGVAGGWIRRLDHSLPRRSRAARNRKDANQPPVHAQHWLLDMV